jgi:hypothetical protein
MNRAEYPPEFDDDSDGKADWMLFTKRTDDPKLSWLERKLTSNGIISRRNGHSFHAPILEVDKADWDEAWKILGPIDDVPDGDPRWDEQA